MVQDLGWYPVGAVLTHGKAWYCCSVDKVTLPVRGRSECRVRFAASEAARTCKDSEVLYGGIEEEGKGGSSTTELSLVRVASKLR